MAVYSSITPLETLEKRLLQRETPDFLERKLEGLIPVFVYGSLREGFHNHDVVKGNFFLGSAVTSIEKYEMREPNHGGFPLVFERSSDASCTTKGKINGEVYVVDPITLLNLDQLEGNGRMYTRKQQWVYLKDQQLGNKTSIRPSIFVWMYMAQPKYWEHKGHYQCANKVTEGKRVYDWADCATYNDQGTWQ